MPTEPKTTELTGESPFCYACGAPLAMACRICGRPFCGRHGSVREALCRKHMWWAIAAWTVVILAGLAIWWFFFRRR